MEFLDNSWHEWLCHTNFSFLAGASEPDSYVQKANQLGYNSIGISDFDGVYGIARAYRALKTLRKDYPSCSLKLNYGAEFHLAHDHDQPICLQDTIVLYALTRRGYFNLCKLITHSHRKGKKEPVLSSDDLLSAPVEDLIAIQPMRGIMRQGNEAYKVQWIERLGKLKSHFSGRLYMAISRHLNPAEDNWIPRILELARHLGVSVIPAQDAFFSCRKEKPICDILQAIRLNQPLSDIPNHLFANSRRCFHSLPVLQKLYGVIPGIRQMQFNSSQLAEQFNFNLNELSYHYPKEMIPIGFTPQQYLEQLVWEAAREKFHTGVPDQMIRLLKHELSMVEVLDFSDYFLTVWDIVRWARSQDILCQGRGSAANSAICYVLGITSINPDQFDLLFERFISVERGDPPDIDVDFENSRREEVIQYIYQRYGRQRAAMICNVITFRHKGAVRFCSKALGIPASVADLAAKMLERLSTRGLTIKDILFAVRQELQKNKLHDDLPDHQWENWAKMSQSIVGFPRHLGIHSGGFMLAETDIDGLVPQEPATMEGRTVIQWSKEDIEALGFFKIDVLALGMLSTIKRCFHLISKHYGQHLSMGTIPENDTETYEMIRNAETVGVFQIESPAQRASLPALKPKTFYDLVVQVAIIRPGPILAGIKHPYIMRRQGLAPVVYADDRLKPILSRTYGTIIFQEQLMRVAMEIGNFSAGEADEIRKNIGSFQINPKVGTWVSRLTQEMIKSKMNPVFIEEVMQQIKGFASYGFPESHAASFALIAYVSCYLKCHYPAAFFTALLNSQPVGFYQPDTLIKTARHDGVQILPIDINFSGWDSRLEELKSQLGVYAIRLGFSLVKGVRKSEIEQIEVQRNQNGTWRTWDHFIESCPLSKSGLSALAAANAFYPLKLNRKSAVWVAEAGSDYIRKENDPAQGNFLHLGREKEAPVDFVPESEMDAVEADYRSMKTSLGRHLSTLIREQAWVYPVPVDTVVTSGSISRVPDNCSIVIFGMVISRQSPGTAKKMLFITLEDEEGSVQVVIPPHVYRNHISLIEKQTFLCVLGKVQYREGSIALKVTQVFNPQARTATVISAEQRNRYQEITQSRYRKIRNYM